MGSGIGLGIIIGLLAALIVTFVALYLRYRGGRIVTCPETRSPIVRDPAPAQRRLEIADASRAVY